ncbi:MAG: PrsW family intramembrane metalloprotease [Verrucomicrobia bacterium]|jgi:hypothetical protein|nr:PrsW family intramembrane metalloprotease [Verrucomicrobiota bacterium]MBT7699269.1 PrsW family intramembrane metalloprotease [Verrucomicrobiota bacterium]
MSKEADSVFDEPQFRGGGYTPDPSDPATGAGTPHADAPLPVGQGAWDEPALSPALAGERPAHVQTYAQWLAAGRARLSATTTWGITLALALGSGAWAIVGAILSQVQGNSAGGLLLMILFGPAAEEMLKISAALITIEKWPYAFRSPVQIVVCCLAAALGFAAIENLIYLHVYIPDPSPGMIAWRWTICVMIHVAGSCIASVGLIKIWRHTMAHGSAPRVSLGSPFFMAAIALHGTYNLGAILLNPYLARL